jgi:hypothetical protein
VSAGVELSQAGVFEDRRGAATGFSDGSGGDLNRTNLDGPRSGESCRKTGIPMSESSRNLGSYRAFSLQSWGAQYGYLSPQSSGRSRSQVGHENHPSKSKL